MKEYYIVKRKAVPDVLIKVAEVDRLLESGKAMTVQEATELLGISRSSYYKYKGDIMPFHDQARGKTITFMLQINDEPGGLSLVLNEVARCHANVLTINQSIPINGIAPVTLNLEIQPETIDVMEMVNAIEKIDGVLSLKIIARE
ncbi:ACT domain-containing protein [Acetivibrio ethanolgignens]|uniref:UPF0735 ACT domain-containing protein ASU35_00050 n=1 Tax=Acetivibrio ethanolgignens TaxID=290052 RepID=A0A0V8QJ21_9FIRM|nr:ACT domain-containing protein [Acetivibrio ethanolgignens]KSV60605.1 hypothetical protein ASU35_00050 [Acetivibrio ethanolgignens]